MGVTQQQTGASMVYQGETFKIPKQLFAEDGEVDFEKDIWDLIQEIRDGGAEPVLHGATVERYETLDVKTGDA
jgi:hypothetical protein